MKSPVLDERHAAQLVAALLARRPGYTPDWLPPDQGPDAALLWIAARYAEHILQRLNQAPEKNKLAFLDLLGIQLTPAQAARAPIVFQMAGQAADTRAPQGTRLAAPPPPDSPQQIVFETEQAAGLMAAQLVEVVSLWPGRDQYIDHSAAHAEGLPFQPWRKKYLENTPHTLYIAHDTLLALSGAASLDVELELVTPSSEHLSILWEYWDGQVWRG
ncbi:MAG: putative baseplate assembly protein, partial [Chloroflexi bacterium]|nr:putative baseplate assembly protein [Chloroflexota bacterium]